MNVRLAYRVFSETGRLEGATRDPEMAAALVAVLSDGAYVRVGRRTVWEEGAEEFSAGDSYDEAADLMVKRELAR